MRASLEDRPRALTCGLLEGTKAGQLELSLTMDNTGDGYICCRSEPGVGAR